MGVLILRANVGLAFYVDKGLIEPEGDLIMVHKDYTTYGYQMYSQ